VSIYEYINVISKKVRQYSTARLCAVSEDDDDDESKEKRCQNFKPLKITAAQMEMALDKIVGNASGRKA